MLLSASAAVVLARRRSTVRGDLDEAERTLAPLRSRQQAIRDLGPDEPPAPPLIDTLIAALAILRAADVRQGVRVETLALPGRGNTLPDGPPDARALAAVSRPLPAAPGLRSLRIDVRASYRSYDGLKTWLAALGALPARLSRVWLEDQHVQLVLELVGT